MTIAPITDLEDGLSVRTKLNSVLGFINNIWSAVQVTFTGSVTVTEYTGVNHLFIRDTASVSGTPNLYMGQIIRVQYGGGGSTGNRFGFMSYWSLDQAPNAADTANPDYTAGTFQAYAAVPAKTGLVGGANYAGGYAGSLWGTSNNVILSLACSNWLGLYGSENEVAINSPATCADRFGVAIYSRGDTNATIEDAGIMIAKSDGVGTVPFANGILFGGVRKWSPTDTNGTLIAAKARSQGGTGPVTARYGIDFSTAVFTAGGAAFRSPGFSVDPLGNVVLTPPASATPAANGEMTFQLTSNTALDIKVKGSDAVVRSATLALGGSGVSLTTDENILANDLTMTTAGTFYDGATLTLAAGTWIIQGQIELIASTAVVRTFTAKLWDGSTQYTIGSHVNTGTAGNARIHIPIHKKLTLGSTTTVRLSATSTVNSDVIKGASGNGATVLTAIRTA